MTNGHLSVLLTGSTGFIGSHVLEQLNNTDYKIICTRRKTSQVVPLKKNVNWVFTDCNNWQQEVIKLKPDIIIHCAWAGGVDANSRNDWERQIGNITFQQELLEIARICGTSRYISLGSQAEYGTFSGCISEDTPTNPNTAYGTVKLASMNIAKAYCEQHNIHWYWLRVFSAFGEREGENWLIPTTVRKMQTEDSMDTTLGEQKYSYLYVGEIARTIIACIETKAPQGIYNISSSEGITIRSLLEKIRDIVNPDFKLNFGALPYRQGQSMWIQGDNTKVCKNIYAINSVNFESDLIHTIKVMLK